MVVREGGSLVRSLFTRKYKGRHFKNLKRGVVSCQDGLLSRVTFMMRIYKRKLARGSTVFFTVLLFYRCCPWICTAQRTSPLRPRKPKSSPKRKRNPRSWRGTPKTVTLWMRMMTMMMMMMMFDEDAVSSTTTSWEDEEETKDIFAKADQKTKAIFEVGLWWSSVGFTGSCSSWELIWKSIAIGQRGSVKYIWCCLCAVWASAVFALCCWFRETFFF